MSPHQIAAQHCTKNTPDCSWYHGNWHLLKSLGVVSTSAVHQQAICRLLKRSLRQKMSAKILLTGSSDESLLRMIRKTAADINCDVKITAVDICETPLIFMQQYANRHQMKLNTYCSDILKYESSERFDVILTHAFMGYFSDETRPQLVNKWQQLLADNGYVVTVQRIRSETAPEIVRFDAKQAEAFVEQVEKAAMENKFSDQQAERIVQVAMDFTKKFSNYSIRSRKEFEKLFTDAGFVFDTLEFHRLESLAKLSGPSVPSNAEFAHVVAGRRKSK